MAPPKLLIVDDSPMNRDILERMLHTEGSVESVSSGEECLEFVTSCLPAVILLDVMMPGLNGFQVCRRLRKMPEMSDTKILIVSARALPSERREGFAAGADDYLTKPFTMDEVRERVAQLLRRV